MSASFETDPLRGLLSMTMFLHTPPSVILRSAGRRVSKDNCTARPA